MLYKFKSQASGDVIMLEANGNQILQAIGKEPAAKGIILPQDMPAAISALEHAIEKSHSAQGEKREASSDASDDNAAAERVSLRQRAAPFIDMLQRCQAENKEIVWGV